MEEDFWVDRPRLTQEEMAKTTFVTAVLTRKKVFVERALEVFRDDKGAISHRVIGCEIALGLACCTSGRGSVQ